MKGRPPPLPGQAWDPKGPPRSAHTRRPGSHAPSLPVLGFMGTVRSTQCHWVQPP